MGPEAAARRDGDPPQLRQAERPPVEGRRVDPGAGLGRLSPRSRHPAIDGPLTPPRPPRTAYERLAAEYRRRNEERHITGGFTAGQRIALDRLWNQTQTRKGPAH